MMKDGLDDCDAWLIQGTFPHTGLQYRIGGIFNAGEQGVYNGNMAGVLTGYGFVGLRSLMIDKGDIK